MTAMTDYVSGYVSRLIIYDVGRLMGDEMPI